MSGEKPFLDTNVLVYCFDPSTPQKQERSRSLVSRSCRARLGAISYQVIAEFTNVALRRFERPMSVADVRDWIRALSTPLEVVGYSGHLFEQALTLFERYRLSWYDALIVSAALEANCTVLFSEDMQHDLRIGPLRVENPFR